MIIQLLWEGIRPAWRISNKYDVPMFKCVFMTYTLHVHDVFDKMPVMVRMSQVRSLFKFYIRGLFLLLFIISKNFIKFWAEAWVLALRNWLRFQGRWHIIALKILQSHGGLAMGANRWLQSLGGIFMGENGGYRILKSKFTQGLGTWSGWLFLGGPIAPEKGQFGLVLLISLP